MRIAISILGAVLFVTTASAQPVNELSRARDSFRAGGLEKAEIILNGLLYPKSRLSAKNEIAQAHLLLGAVHFEHEDFARARREFEEALSIERSLTLDPILFSKESVIFFDDIKERVNAREEAERQQADLARERLRIQGILKDMVVLEKRSYWVNFIPFGAGQFQNGQRKKGVAFLAFQVALGGASAGLYGYQVIKYGGGVPPESVSSVNRIRATQIATGALFWGAVAWGIADSLIHYEHVVSRKADPSLLRELDRGQAAPKARVTPSFTHESFGATFSVDF